MFFERNNRAAFVLALLFVAGVIGFVLFPPGASAQVNFGGPITLFEPICQVPPATEITVGPPSAMPLMYIAGMTYANGPPSHPGQELLGKAVGWMPCIILVPCFFGVCPVVVGGGFIILFTGSSE